MFLRRYFGDKPFYKMVLAVALPIILQNFITNLVNMLDNVMVGSLGTEQMSGVAIVNQIIFVFNLCIFGSFSGAGVFASQYFGKGDMDGIRYTMRFKTAVCGAITVIAFIIFIFGGRFLINLFLHEGSHDCDISLAMDYAVSYLRVSLIGLVPYAATQMLASTLKETGETFVPMVAGVMALAVNTILNYLLIFGIGFFPRLGVEGAALGTVISRFAECGVIAVYISRSKNKHPYFIGAFGTFAIPKKELKEFTVKAIPLLGNEFLWALGMSLLAMSYSNYGLAVVAGYSISSTVLNLLNITFRSLGIAVGIIAGKDLGAGEFDKAVDDVRKLNFFSVLVSIAIGIITLIIAEPVTNIYNVSLETKEYAQYFIKTSALFMPFLCYENSAYFTMRAGGKVLITALSDGIFVFFITMPIAFLFLQFAPVSVTYLAVQMADVLKAGVGFFFIKSKTWVRNIVA